MPLVILVALRLGISDAAREFFFPILPPPKAVHAAEAVVEPVPPLPIATVPVTFTALPVQLPLLPLQLPVTSPTKLAA